MISVWAFLAGAGLACLFFFVWFQKKQERAKRTEAENARLSDEKANLVSENQTFRENTEKLTQESSLLKIKNGQWEKETEMLKSRFEEKFKEKEQAFQALDRESRRAKEEQKAENKHFQEEKQSWAGQSASLKAENQRLKKELESREALWKETSHKKEGHFRELQEKNKQLMEQLMEKTKTDFGSAARKIIEENTKSHREEASKNMSLLLQPFKEDFENFKKSIQNIEEKEKSLGESIKDFAGINAKMRDEAKELSFALKGDVKVQGQWGEFVLSNILEKSGLREGEEFFLQGKGLPDGITDEEGGALKPDAVVKLPDNKHIVIDSKVSLTHYREWLGSIQEEKRRELLGKIRRSVSSHIENLASKRYSFSKSLNSPDFTLMFVPNEGVFSFVVTDDKTNLLEKAWKKSVILVGPTNLFAVLKTVASLWKMERQSRNAEEIARQGGLLYDKIIGFLEDMGKIGDSLKKAGDSYDSALGKLKTGRGNIVQRAIKLQDLGVRNRKELPPHFHPPNSPP